MQIKCCYLFLDVLQEEGRGSQIVHRDVEEALNLFLMEVHGDQVGETCTNAVRLTLMTFAITAVATMCKNVCRGGKHTCTSYQLYTS